ncbi:MAG: hypothetical protein Q4G35_06630 [Propionibacteriaceae bacterium]|nr:hypothetical protein [Propionibacteriaceae bacterium]
MTRAWWRRNFWWMVALVPALVLALATSSFRLVNLYLPWEWSRPTVAGASVGTLEQRYNAHDGKEHDRKVTVEVLSVKSVPRFEDHAAIVGATLWEVQLRLSASPDQDLKHCTIELVDAEGTRYGFEGGRRAADPDDRFYSSTVSAPYCVPEDTPGPTVDGFTGEWSEPEVPRPESWELRTAMVLPDGYEPVQVRIGWKMPEYLVLDIDS